MQKMQADKSKKANRRQMTARRCQVAHACNPSYSGGRDQED
jgi:hypothetical protein